MSTTPARQSIQVEPPSSKTFTAKTGRRESGSVGSAVGVDVQGMRTVLLSTRQCELTFHTVTCSDTAKCYRFA